MDNKALGLCAIAAVLGIIAAATGFVAEATRIKPSQAQVYEGNTCDYPSSPAFALGIISAVFTVITQIYIVVVFGKAGCCPREDDSTPISKFHFKFSWVASIVAVVLLVTAVGLSTRQREGKRIDFYHIECDGVKPGIFAAGASLALLSAVLGIAAYITLNPPLQTNTNPAVALPVGANVDPEENPAPLPPQQN